MKGTIGQSTMVQTLTQPALEHHPIYLDYNATTPLDPAVVTAMRPYLEQQFGNPSSGHTYGQVAKAAMETARAQVAAPLGCAPEAIVFTGGGPGRANLGPNG